MLKSTRMKNTFVLDGHLNHVPGIAAVDVSHLGKGIAAFLDLLGISPDLAVIGILVLAHLHM